MNKFIKAIIVLGLAFDSSNFQVDAKSSKSVGSNIQSGAKSGKGSTIVSNAKDAGLPSSTTEQPNAADVSTVAKSGKSSDISHDMSMAKSGKADVAYDMSMAKSGKANVSYNEMSMMDNAAQRTGGKTTKQAKSTKRG